jgi:WD40 repeat protein
LCFSVDESSFVKLWSKDGKLLNTLKGHTSYVSNVSFSPDGQFLQTLMGHNWQVNSVRFSPDSKTLVSASDDKIVILWNLADLQLDQLMQDACFQLRNYLKNDAPAGDRYLCQGIN